MIISGVLLTIPEWEYRLSEFVFYIKMGFVLVLIMNAFAIGSLASVASERPFEALSIEEKRALLFSGGLSFLGWVGATIIGVFFL